MANGNWELPWRWQGHTVDGSEIPRPTTWDGAENPVNDGINYHTYHINWCMISSISSRVNRPLHIRKGLGNQGMSFFSEAVKVGGFFVFYFLNGNGDLFIGKQKYLSAHVHLEKCGKKMEKAQSFRNTKDPFIIFHISIAWRRMWMFPCKQSLTFSYRSNVMSKLPAS